LLLLISVIQQDSSEIVPLKPNKLDTRNLVLFPYEITFRLSEQLEIGIPRTLYFMGHFGQERQNGHFDEGYRSGDKSQSERQLNILYFNKNLLEPSSSPLSYHGADISRQNIIGFFKFRHPKVGRDIFQSLLL
jgi:hypothetical protein